MRKQRVAALVGAVAVLAAGGCSPRAVRLGPDRSGQVVFEDEAPSDLAKTKVLRLKVIQELPDLLVLDVEYNYVPAPEEDSCYLYIWPDGDGWYTQPLHFQPGRNIGSIPIGLEKETARGESSHLRMTVTTAREKKALRPVFERIAPLPKVWGHRASPAGKAAGT